MAMKIVVPPPTSIPGGRVIAAGGKIRLHRPPGEGACLGAYYYLLIRDTPSEEVYVLNMFRMRGSRL